MQQYRKFLVLCWRVPNSYGSRERLLPGESLVSLLQGEKISVVTLPPVVLNVIPLQEFPQLQTIVVAGEACPINLINQWAKQYRFINAYGPPRLQSAPAWAFAILMMKKHPSVSLSRMLNSMYWIETYNLYL